MPRRSHGECSKWAAHIQDQLDGAHRRRPTSASDSEPDERPWTNELPNQRPCRASHSPDTDSVVYIEFDLSCPVCGVNLVDIGPAPLQEAHVKNCLEGGTGTSPQSAKYLVYKLPEESALIGTECKSLTPRV